MGKGRWQPGAANRNQAGPQGQRLEPGNEHGLSEPCAVKSRMHGSSGGKAPQGAYLSQFLHHDLAVIERCQQIAQEWLAGVGLELKPSKTRITHTLREHEGNLGFEFLGFHVRQYPTSERRSGRTTRGQPLGFKTLIKPSKEAQRRHLAALRQVMRNMKAAPQQALIARLNPIIRGWTRYYASCVAKATFSRMDHLTFAKLTSWARRRHPNKGSAWVCAKYWRLETGHWTFAEKGGPRLYRHSQTPIQRHVKVRGDKSPFDGDGLYWSARLGRHPDVEPIAALLLKRQQGKCPWCGHVFRDGDLWERDHVVPISRGGSPRLDNLQLLHRHCHDAKSACDGSQAKRGTHDNEPKN
jgi:RNA-directed DNA polymerase